MEDRKIDNMWITIGFMLVFAVVVQIGIFDTEQVKLANTEVETNVVEDKYMYTTDSSGTQTFMQIGNTLDPHRIGGGERQEYGVLIDDRAYTTSQSDWNELSIGYTIEFRIDSDNTELHLVRVIDTNNQSDTEKDSE